MMVKERDILNKPIMFISENDKTFAYTRGFTNSGLPFYTPPSEKNVRENYRLDEFIFLPISDDNFNDNKKDLFFGFRYLISVNNFSTVNFMNNPDLSLTKALMEYEIARVRYYPDGKKSIVIDRSYDSLFPTQRLEIQCSTQEIGPRVASIMSDIVDMCCNWYVDKKI